MWEVLTFTNRLLSPTFHESEVESTKNEIQRRSGTSCSSFTRRISPNPHWIFRSNRVYLNQHSPNIQCHELSEPVRTPFPWIVPSDVNGPISDSENSFDSIDVNLDNIFPLINQDDPEHVPLYTQLPSDRNPLTFRDELITLLFWLVKRFSLSSTKLNDLVSYLQSHVALLQALTCDPELASLFFIGQHGSQSFKSIPESVLSEQTRRTRQLIKTLPPH
jgi:hypothetical protein